MVAPTDNIAADPHHFDFDLDRGIREQVVEKLEASPLLSMARGVGPALSGIYALYFKGKLVYIGRHPRARQRVNGRCAVGLMSTLARLKSAGTSQLPTCSAAI
jgi:hypothetical protein